MTDFENMYSVRNTKLPKLKSISAITLLTLSAFAVVLVVAVPAHAQSPYQFQEYFTMDANNPTPAINTGWSTLATKSATSTSQALNSSLGLILTAATSSSKSEAGYGIVQNQAQSLSGTVDFVTDMVKFQGTTSNVESDFYLANFKSTTGIPACTHSQSFLHLYVTAAGIPVVDFCTGGSVTTEFTGSATPYAVWVVDQSGGTVSGVYLDTGSGFTEVWTGASLGFTSGYSYIIEETSSTTAVSVSSQFFLETSGDGVTTASIAKGMAYLSRAYDVLYTKSQSPDGIMMAVMRDTATVPIEVVDTTSGKVLQMGEAGATIQPFCPYGGSYQECETINGLLGAVPEPLGTRLLFSNDTFQSAMLSFTISGIEVPNIVLRVNVTANSVISTTYSVKELVYCTSLTSCNGDSVNVYLGKYLLFSGNKQGSIATITESHFGFMSNRYVGRHITEVASQIFSELGFANQSANLMNFVGYYYGGSTTGSLGSYEDYYAPLSGSDTGYSQDYLWSSNAFPDASLPHALPTVNTYPYAYPYASRLTLPCAAPFYAYGSSVLQCGFTYGLNSELSACVSPTNGFPLANYAPPATDALLADHLAHLYGTTNSTNSGIISQLITGAGWDGTGARLKLAWFPNILTCSFVGGINYNFPSYTGYALGVFLGAVSDLYKLTSSSTYLTDAKQSAAVEMGTQINGQGFISGYSGKVELPSSVGGFLSSYIKSSGNYTFSSDQSGPITDLSSALYSRGYFGIQPPEWPGFDPTDTEATGVGVQALLNYNADVATPVTTIVQGSPILPTSTSVTNVPGSGQAAGNIAFNYNMQASDNGSWSYSYPPGTFSNLGTAYTLTGVKSSVTLTKDTVQPEITFSGLLNASANAVQNEVGCASSPCQNGRAAFYAYAKIYNSGGTLLGTNYESIFSSLNYTTTTPLTILVNKTIPFPSLDLGAGTYTVEVGFNTSAYGTEKLVLNPRSQVFSANLIPALPYAESFAGSGNNLGAASDRNTLVLQDNGYSYIFYSDGSCIQEKATTDNVHFTSPEQIT